MHRFETLDDFLTFADTYDCIIFEKYRDNGVAFGVYNDEIYDQNDMLNNALNHIKDLNIDLTKYDAKNFDQDKFMKDLEEAERANSYSTEALDEITQFNDEEYFNYKSWSEWATDGTVDLKRDCVIMNSKNNKNSRFMKLLAKAKQYLDKEKFDFKKDKTFIDWRCSV